MVGLAQILLDGINKTFRIAQRPPGFLGALRGAFVREHKEIHALNDVSFQIDEGELVGYIGPNGAGKSTTVKVMSGILVPDSGSCAIMGRVPWQQRTSHVAEIGVVFGQRSQLWWDLPVQDSFSLLKDIYKIKDGDYRRRLQDLTGIFELGSLVNTPVRQLSLGQRIRCELTASLLHNPKILFLDEPTIGLDAVSKLALRDFLKEMNRRHNVTMILTTHDMDDIETLCQRVMVIGHGNILYDGQLDGLRSKYAPLRCIRAKLAGPVKIDSIPGAESVEIQGNQCLVRFRPDQVPTGEMLAALAAHIPLKDLVVEEEDIDRMIARMYQEFKLCDY